METNRVLGDRGISATPDGFQVEVRLPWYRSLPLSVVEVGEVSVDGATVDLTKVQFELEGHRYPLSDMPELTQKVWYVLDSAFLNVAGVKLSPGTQHEIGVILHLYPPYIRGLKRVSRESKTLRVS